MGFRDKKKNNFSPRGNYKFRHHMSQNSKDDWGQVCGRLWNVYWIASLVRPELALLQDADVPSLGQLLLPLGLPDLQDRNSRLDWKFSNIGASLTRMMASFSFSSLSLPWTPSSSLLRRSSEGSSAVFLYLARCVDDDTEGGDVVDMAVALWSKRDKDPCWNAMGTSEEKSSCCPSLGEEIWIMIFFANSSFGQFRKSDQILGVSASAAGRTQ